MPFLAPKRHFLIAALLLLVATQSGCIFVPEVSHQPQFHNPFPQLHRVAILPFVNQSDDPTINGADVANRYRAELQQIRGFEVMPLGVVEAYLRSHRVNFDERTDFQKLAQALGVDAVVIGAITDFDPYYPPRMGLAVSWYAANSGFHPIPPGYGLPWGTPEEELIPDDLVFEAEFALARAQLETQTPEDPANNKPIPPQEFEEKIGTDDLALGVDGLPPDWPDPRGFIPQPPSPDRPDYRPHDGPVMQLVRQYDGANNDFTTKLQSYYYFRDDGRVGGWKRYLDRKHDFMQFCCYLHITEMLTARGGGSETRLVLRWPFSRYEE